MNFELYIDGEKKIFTTPVVPMLARRKYLEIMTKAEEKEKDKNYIPTTQEQMEEENEFVGILANVVFAGQFTVEQVFAGASYEYVLEKLREACFGKPKENKEGNQTGK